MWTFSYLASFATLWQNLFAQHQLGWLSMRSAEWVWQRGSSCDVTAGLSRNRRACVLSCIIGVPCNVPLPRGSDPFSCGSTKWVESGLNGAPVSFKQTQHSPPLFYMLHPTAGSTTAAHTEHNPATLFICLSEDDTVKTEYLKVSNIRNASITLRLSNSCWMKPCYNHVMLVCFFFFFDWLTENKCLKCM